MYDLILESKAKNARRFRRWVTTEILPSIRMTGGYIPIQEEEPNEVFLARAVQVANETIKHKDEIISRYSHLYCYVALFLFIVSVGSQKEKLYTVGSQWLPTDMTTNIVVEILNDKEVLVKGTKKTKKGKEPKPFKTYISTLHTTSGKEVGGYRQHH